LTPAGADEASRRRRKNTNCRGGPQPVEQNAKASPWGDASSWPRDSPLKPAAHRAKEKPVGVDRCFFIKKEKTMEVKIDINTGEIYEEVSNEEFKEIMRAWTARKVSDEDFEEIRNVWKTTIIRCEDCPL
jgi:hypothetical protein